MLSLLLSKVSKLVRNLFLELKTFENIPIKGLVVLSGLMYGEGTIEKEQLLIFEPLVSLSQFRYCCQSTFDTMPLA